MKAKAVYPIEDAMKNGKGGNEYSGQEPMIEDGDRLEEAAMFFAQLIYDNWAQQKGRVLENVHDSLDENVPCTTISKVA